MWLRFTTGERAGETLELTAEQTVIGRDEGCDVRVDHEKVSRCHAAFERTADGRFQIRDLGSTNGTFVDGVRLEANAPRTLSGGEHVRVGGIELAVSAAAPGQAAPTVVGGAPPTVLGSPPVTVAAPPGAPPPTLARPPEDGRGRFLSGPGKWIAVGLAGAALVAGGITAGLLLTDGGDEATTTTPAPPTVVTVVVTETLPAATSVAQETTTAETEATPVDTATTPAETTAEAAFSDGELALLQHVPESFRSACTGRGQNESDPAGTTASVYCETPEGIDVWYFQTDSSASMLDEYDRILGDDPRDSGECATDDLAESSYSQDGESAGRYFCFDDDEFGRAIVWTHDPTSILTEAALASADREALATWWASNVNPLP
jgi:hypothetical protein